MRIGRSLVAVVALVGACSMGNPGLGIDGFWEVESFHIDGSTQKPLVGSNVARTPWVSILEDRIEGMDGCNGFGGTFLMDGTATLIPEEIFSQAALCLDGDGSPDDFSLMQGDEAFRAVLNGPVSVAIDGSVMTWANGDYSIIFVSVSAPPTTEPHPPPSLTEIGRLDCSPEFATELRVPDDGQPPLDVARSVDPNVVAIEPGQALWYSGLNEAGEVIVELALGDSTDADYLVWTCED